MFRLLPGTDTDWNVSEDSIGRYSIVYEVMDEPPLLRGGVHVMESEDDEKASTNVTLGAVGGTRQEQQ